MSLLGYRATYYVVSPSPTGSDEVVEELFFHSKQKCVEYMEKENKELAARGIKHSKERWKWSSVHTEDEPEQG